uniref:Cation efflux protein cytoplasmic domain-containing protein n=1 Tax=Globisporangium ultimum (strain ATCC 200006 / CBS 805.95 / DAOM BR144) TaxID=431595 RepID=K3X9E4_GLOUD
MQWQQKRFLLGHSHTGGADGHGHSHGILGFGDHNDDEEETEAMKRKLNEQDVKAADKITWAGIYINVVLSGVKGVAGVAFNSAGLLADAVHSMSDLISDGITLVALKYCSRPPDQFQPYGYGKYETIGALSVSVLLVGGSLAIIDHSFDTLMLLLQPAVPVETQLAAYSLEPEVIESIKAIMSPESPSFFHHDHTASNDALMIHPAALGIAAGSVAAKEALYRATINIGKKINSSVLIANAWHHRSDAVTSVVAMAGIGLSLAGLPMFDPLAGMVVGGIILKMGGEIGYSATKELCDSQLSEKIMHSLEDAVEGVVSSSNGDIVEVKQLRSRRIGRNLHVDLTLVMSDSGSLSFEKACEWKDKVKVAIQRNVPRVKDIIIELATPQQSPSTIFEEQSPEERPVCHLNEDSGHGHSHGPHGHHHHH